MYMYILWRYFVHWLKNCILTHVVCSREDVCVFAVVVVCSVAILDGFLFGE